MRDLRIIEPRTTRIVKARDMINNLAYDLSRLLDTNPKTVKIFNEYSGK